MANNRFRRIWLFSGLSTILLFTRSMGIAAEANSSYEHQNKIVAAYFEEWSIYGANYNIADMQTSGAADALTHVLYAFANINSTGRCAIADGWADYQKPNVPSVNGQPYAGPLYGNFAALMQLKQLHPNMKVLISIGGASAANTASFATAAATSVGRSQLASSCIDMFITGNIAPEISAVGLFDGIDLDWEFPAAADKENFTALVNEFRTQLTALGAKNKQTYLLTMAAPAGSQNYSNIQLAAVGEQLDFFNVETYDYHGTWETTTNHAAPLLESPLDPARGQGFYIEGTISAYLQAGVPARKLVLGIPAYGRGWTGVPNVHGGLYQTSSAPAPYPAGDSLMTDGLATYRTLTALTSQGFAVNRDVLSLADWLYNPAKATFWTYDDPASVAVKMGYVRLRSGGLGGAFEWAIKDDDANATLLKTMANALSFDPESSSH